MLANGGVRHPVSMLRRDEVPEGERVLSEKVVSQILPMLQSVVEKGGTATRAAIPGYRVGGKTGTVRKVTAGGYSTNHYLALFSGIAPLSHPRLVMAVMINDPGGRSYYGGQVAAQLIGIGNLQLAAQLYPACVRLKFANRITSYNVCYTKLLRMPPIRALGLRHNRRRKSPARASCSRSNSR